LTQEKEVAWLYSESSKDVRVDTKLMETFYLLGSRSRRNLMLFQPLHYSRQRELSDKAIRETRRP
jgi:hypothetical protein